MGRGRPVDARAGHHRSVSGSHRRPAVRKPRRMTSICHLAATALSDWTSTISRGLRETTMGYGLDSELLADDLDRFLATLRQRYRGASAAAAAARPYCWRLRSHPNSKIAQ